MAKSFADRSAAVRANGDHMIRAYVMKASEIDARLWEISENLHRAELSALERAEQIDEWRAPTAEKGRNATKGKGCSECRGLPSRSIRRKQSVEDAGNRLSSHS